MKTTDDTKNDTPLDITVTINTSNAAFAQDSLGEIARILTDLGTKLVNDDVDLCTAGGIILRDINNEPVGKVTIR